MPLPSRRNKLEQVQNPIWIKKKFKDSEIWMLRSNSSSLLGGTGKRICSDLETNVAAPVSARLGCLTHNQQGVVVEMGKVLKISFLLLSRLSMVSPSQLSWRICWYQHRGALRAHRHPCKGW